MTSVRSDSLAGQPWLVSEPLQRLLSVLGGDEGKARVAGGAVRNALLKEPVEDVDVATVHAPQDTIALCEANGFAVHPTGIEHGTVTVVAHHGDVVFSYEVTTLRADIETDGRRAKVAFTGDWAGDAARRDFTINALYCGADGTVFDPLGGLDDIASRTVRFVGDPRERIREDYLRILRFFRFLARYGHGEPDGDGLAACVELRRGLARLSAERVRAELFKILTAPRAAGAVALMDEAGVLAEVLPPGFDVGRFQRMLNIDECNGLAADAMLRLAALAGTGQALAGQLRLSNAEAGRLAALAGNGQVTPELRDRERKVVLYQLGEDTFRDAVRFCWSGHAAAADDGGWGALLRLADDWPVPEFPVSGADLLGRGCSPGPQIGEHLRLLEDWWIAEGFAPDKSAVLAQLAKQRE